MCLTQSLVVPDKEITNLQTFITAYRVVIADRACYLAHLQNSVSVPVRCPSKPRQWVCMHNTMAWKHRSEKELQLMLTDTPVLLLLRGLKMSALVTSHNSQHSSNFSQRLMYLNIYLKKTYYFTQYNTIIYR